jgi:hypothetical protein
VEECECSTLCLQGLAHTHKYLPASYRSQFWLLLESLSSLHLDRVALHGSSLPRSFRSMLEIRPCLREYRRTRTLLVMRQHNNITCFQTLLAEVRKKYAFK